MRGWWVESRRLGRLAVAFAARSARVRAALIGDGASKTIYVRLFYNLISREIIRQWRTFIENGVNYRFSNIHGVFI